MLSERELDDFLGNFSGRKTTVKKINYPVLSARPGMPGAKVPIAFINDVMLDIWAELGETSLTVREILNLKEDSVIELQKAAGDTVNLKINGQEFARGEVIIIGSNLGIRVDRIYETKSGKNKDQVKNG